MKLKLPEEVKMKGLIFLIVGILLCFNTPAFAANSNTCANYYDNKCHYSSTNAVNYALSMIDNKNTWNAYFPSYRASELGGDCTNFASQAILAGLIGTTSPQVAYNNSESFAIDSNGCTYCWYFKHESNASYAWKGANELYIYAEENANPSYKGLHFQLRTEDNPTQALDFSRISEGDIIFADWEGNGVVDHTMIVTRKRYNGYYGIDVTYENADPHPVKKNVSLGSINSTNTIFYVYRPIYYTDYGY